MLLCVQHSLRGLKRLFINFGRWWRSLFGDLILNNRFYVPLFGVDGWLNMWDLVICVKRDELNVLFAIESRQQMVNLNKMLFDRVKLAMSTSSSTLTSTATCMPKKLAEHVFVFCLDGIKLHSHLTSHYSQMCSVRYTFLCAAKNRIEHRIVLDRVADLSSKMLKRMQCKSHTWAL